LNKKADFGVTRFSKREIAHHVPGHTVERVVEGVGLFQLGEPQINAVSLKRN
jgi:hypothetical protein